MEDAAGEGGGGSRSLDEEGEGEGGEDEERGLHCASRLRCGKEKKKEIRKKEKGTFDFEYS